MKMSVVRYPESMADLQIWDNAAFDNGESEDSSAMSFKSSWNHSIPVVLSSSESLNSFSSKENQNPLFENNRLPVKSQFNALLLPSKSIHQNRRLKTAVTAAAAVSTQSSVLKSRNEDSVKDDGIHNDDDDDNKNVIDLEIEEIEKEIIRLNSRLDALRIEKAEKLVKTAEKRGGGRVIPAKFMEQKQGFKNGGEVKKKVEEEEEEDDFLISMSSKSKLVRGRRGLSMGPSEIVGSGARRAGNNGLSLGPAEIFAGTRTIGKKESAINNKTPIQTIQNRRKSCFWKLQEIDEEEEEEMRKKKKSSRSVSPKSKKIMNNGKNQVSRQAATTIGSRKISKREESILNSIQPKKLLFKDGEKSSSIPASAGTANKKKPSSLRQGRIVPSRYNNHQQGSAAMRKRSLPENNNDQEHHDDGNGDDDDEESKRFDKKPSLLYVGKAQLEEIKKYGRVKKRWEIPTEIPVVVLHRNSLSPPPPPAPATTTTISDVPELLPSIKTTRCLIETPRDSGPAKRVAELVGRKSYFSIDEELEKEEPFSSSSSSVCQALNFADDDEELK